MTCNQWTKSSTRRENPIRPCTNEAKPGHKACASHILIGHVSQDDQD